MLTGQSLLKKMKIWFRRLCLIGVTAVLGFEGVALQAETELIQNQYAELAVDGNAKVIYLRDRVTRQNLLSAGVRSLSTLTYLDERKWPTTLEANRFRALGGGRYEIGYTGSAAAVEIQILVNSDHFVIHLTRAEDLPAGTAFIKFFGVTPERVPQRMKDWRWADEASPDTVFLYSLGLNAITTGQRYYDKEVLLQAGDWNEPRTIVGASGAVVTAPKAQYEAVLQGLITKYGLPYFIHERKCYRYPEKPVVWDARSVTAMNTPVSVTLSGYSRQDNGLTFQVVTPPTRGTISAIQSIAKDKAVLIYTPNENVNQKLDFLTFKAADSRNISEAATLVVLIGLMPEGQDLAPRKPQWPLKSSRVLYSDAQVQRARLLCQTDPSAQAILRALKSESASRIVRSDEELRRLLPDERVGRCWQDSVNGCPVHGKDVFKFGTYPYNFDLDHPFTMICPIGGERYPDNDFGAFYRSGFTRYDLLQGSTVDPGRGWLAPDGEKRWMVVHANNRYWSSMRSVIGTLSKTYLLTGDPIYAEKGLALLDRLAEVYPKMQYHLQSRYSEMIGGSYRGKISYHISEGPALARDCSSYDFLFDALIGDSPVNLPWRSAPDIRANIEANLLEEGIDAVKRRDISGNFGMHQHALAYAASIRQNGPIQNLLQSILRGVDVDVDSYTHQGLDYAFYNLILKDGMPYENSASYDSTWVDELLSISQALDLAGIDIKQHYKMKAMADVFIDLICLGTFTPAFGDAGSITSKMIAPYASSYESMYRYYRDPRYAWMLKSLGGLGTKTFSTFEDLFKDPLPAETIQVADAYHRAVPSRFFDGLGLTILNNPQDTVAAALHFGRPRSHYHYDRLQLELFAYGHKAAPDLGYPDFMNGYVSGIISWSQNTISHNTLVVDDARQTGKNRQGEILHFYQGDGYALVDVDAGAGSAYHQCDTYRRTLLLVNTDPDHSYLVDVFRVSGGQKNYVLSMHGGEGDFHLLGAALTPTVTEGTLAGSTVKYGELYDDSVLGDPGYRGSFGGYKGSGYSHLFNWQKGTPSGVVTGEWKFKGDPLTSLRVHVAPSAQQAIVVADAYVSPTRKIDTILKYMLAQRPPNPQGDTFVTVWEPYPDAPRIQNVEVIEGPSLGVGKNKVVALAVHRRDGSTDHISLASEEGQSYSLPGKYSSDALAVVVNETGGALHQAWALGGSFVEQAADQKRSLLSSTVKGPVVAVDYGTHTVTLELSSALPDAQALVGKTVRLFNASHGCVYRIDQAQQEGTRLTLKLGGSDIFIGRVQIASLDSQTGTMYTKTYLPVTDFSGTRLLKDDKMQAALIDTVGARSSGQHRITLKIPADYAQFSSGADAWIADFGLGDEAEIQRDSAFDLGGGRIEPSPSYGDVSGDGSITASDAWMVARYAVELIKDPEVPGLCSGLSAEEFKRRGDVDGKPGLSANDAMLIARRAVGLIDHFPVEGS